MLNEATHLVAKQSGQVASLTVLWVISGAILSRLLRSPEDLACKPLRQPGEQAWWCSPQPGSTVPHF